MNPSFSLLPDDIIVSYLARIPRSYYPTLSTVCKTFHSLLTSTELYEERSRLENTEQCLYVCLTDNKHQFSQWFMLCVNPNGTRKLVGPFPTCNSHSVSSSMVVGGSEIYVMGRPIDGSSSSYVRILDCRNHTWRDAPSINVCWNNETTLAYDGKIYVTGERGTKEVDVFDIKTQTWTLFPVLLTEASEYFLRIAEIEGTVYLHTFSHVQYQYNLYGYDAKQGKWECCDNKNVMISMLSYSVMHLHLPFNYLYGNGGYACMWYDVNSGDWKEVKGLVSFQEKHMSNDESYGNTRKLVSFGAKLLLFWERDMRPFSNYTKKKKDIWCAEIAIRKRKRNGDEVWGNVEWVGVVHSGPRRLLNCHTVSVCI